MYTLDKDNTALLIIDIQERLLKVMPQVVYENVKKNVITLIEGFKLLNLPILYTQQYTKGLGDTDKDIKELIEGEHIEKNKLLLLWRRKL